MRSSAQVSDATTQSSPIRPSVSGRKPTRVAERDERVVDERRHRVGALEPAHRVRNGVHERRSVARDERSDHLGVRARGELDAVRDELGAELLDVDEVAVVAERDVRALPWWMSGCAFAHLFAPVVE